jgi:hypothetical protein
VRRPEALARRRQALVARSNALRTQMGEESRAIEAVVAQGLSLGRVGLGAAALMTGLLALRKRTAGRSRWRLLASGLKLLPLALGLWRSMQAARRPAATARAPGHAPGDGPHADRSP